MSASVSVRRGGGGGGRKGDGGRKEKFDGFPIIAHRHDRYCAYCKKRIPNQALRKTPFCPSCKRPLCFRSRVHKSPTNQSVFRCLDCDSLCISNNNYCQMCGWRTPTGDQWVEIIASKRRKEDLEETMLNKVLDTVEDNQRNQQQQQQQQRLDQQQVQLTRQREMQLRQQQEIEKAAKELEERQNAYVEAQLHSHPLPEDDDEMLNDE